jgi:predicted aspartyl protease
MATSGIARMKKLCFAIVATLVASSAQAQNCKLQLIASLPLTEDHYGMPLVPATLGGKHTVMLVDTGGTYSMVGQHVVDELKPDEGTIAKNGFTLVSSRELKKTAHIRPFALGEMSAPEFDFLVLPDGVVASKDLDGTIAPDILANFDVEFDFAGKKMNLFSQDHCEGKVVYWAKDWSEISFRMPDKLHIGLDIVLDGKPMQAELDTGSSFSYMSASTAKEMFGVEPPPAKAENGQAPKDMRRGDADEARSYPHTFGTLSANGFAISHPQFLILPDVKARNLDHHGAMLLGMSELRRLHLYIAYKEQVLV